MCIGKSVVFMADAVFFLPLLIFLFIVVDALSNDPVAAHANLAPSELFPPLAAASTSGSNNAEIEPTQLNETARRGRFDLFSSPSSSPTLSSKDGESERNSGVYS